MNRDLRSKFKEKSVALKLGNKEKLKTIQTEIDKMVKTSKRQYKDKIEGNFQSNDNKQAWIGLKNLTGYSTKKQLNINVDIDELNKFYARFDDARVTRVYPEGNSISDQGIIAFSPEEE